MMTLNTLSHSHLSANCDNNFMLIDILMGEMLVSILQQKVVGSHHFNFFLVERLTPEHWPGVSVALPGFQCMIP